jgi:hypothetical protein
MERLEGIAYKAVKQTGLFHNRPALYLHQQVICFEPVYSKTFLKYQLRGMIHARESNFGQSVTKLRLTNSELFYNTMGHRPLPAVRDFTRDGRWSTYDVSVLKKMGGRCAQTGNPLKLPSPTNLARLGHFPPASEAGRLAGPVFYVSSAYHIQIPD